MKKHAEYRLICEGDYADVNEAKNALQTPFIEDFVEETGRFRHHDLENIRVTNRISLADLEIAELGPGRFEITCRNAQVPLNRPKAEKLAENIRRQWVFDQIYLEPLGPGPVNA